MGTEAACRATFKGQSASGRARLEAATLEFRSPALSLTIPFKTIKTATAMDGTLKVSSGGGVLTLDLGAKAPVWAEKIRHPKSRLDKLGVKPAWRVSIVGKIDSDFLGELIQRRAQVSSRLQKASDAIFFAANAEADLKRLPALKSAMRPDGALWVIRPKGRQEISERAVMAAGKAAGLVDVKVVSFSLSHTAEKFVIPVTDR